jgi:hypothetical protein
MATTRTTGDMACNNPLAVAVTAPKTFLARMPAEILSRICEEILLAAEDTPSLARLARTCRVLNEPTIRQLYRHIADELPRSRSALRPSSLKALHLQRTLYTSPGLGKLVQTLRFQFVRVSAAFKQNGNFQSFPHYQAALQHFFDLDPTQPRNLQEPIHIMMLARLTPNLTKLDLRAALGWGNTNFLLQRVNRRVTGPRFVLHHLTDLTVRFWKRDNARPSTGLNLEKLNGLLHTAPNIERLYVACPRGGTSLTCRLRNLTVLVLSNAHLCARGLRFLLRECDKLHSFIVEQDQAPPVHRFRPVSPAEIVTCLAPSKQTLQRLHIIPWCPGPDHVYHAQYSLLEHLGDFPALKHIALDYRAIAPPLAGNNPHETFVRLLRGLGSLETVFQFSLEPSFYREFMCFAGAVAAMWWPRLKLIKLQPFGHPSPSEVQRYLAELVDQLRNMDAEMRRLYEVGVRVRIVWGPRVVADFREGGFY